MLTGFSFVRSFASRLRGGAWLRGKLRAGRVMPVFTPLRSVKTGTGLSAPLEQGPRRFRPSLADPVTPLAAPPSDNGPLSDAPLAAPRPRPPLARCRPRSALHNRGLCKLPLRQPPPLRAHARPTVPGFLMQQCFIICQVPPVHPSPMVYLYNAVESKKSDL